MPFQEMNRRNIGRFLYLVQGNYRPKIAYDFPSVYKQLVQSCWNGDETKRCDFSSIVNKLKSDEFVSNLNVDKDYFEKYCKMIDREVEFNEADFHVISPESIFKRKNK